MFDYRLWIFRKSVLSSTLIFHGQSKLIGCYDHWFCRSLFEFILSFPSGSFLRRQFQDCSTICHIFNCMFPCIFCHIFSLQVCPQAWKKIQNAAMEYRVQDGKHGYFVRCSITSRCAQTGHSEHRHLRRTAEMTYFG